MDPDLTLFIEKGKQEQDDIIYNITPITRRGIEKPYCVQFNKMELRDTIQYVSGKLEQILKNKTYPEDMNVPYDVYRRSIEIPSVVCKDDLGTIAEIDLSEFIFPKKCEQAQKYKEMIKEMASRIRPMTIRINAPEDFIFPWPLIYDGEPPPPNSRTEINREQFWGFNYIIEDQMPLNYDDQIKTSDLVIGFNVHMGFDTDEETKEYSIDSNTGIGCVREHIDFFNSIKGAKPIIRPDPNKLINDFHDKSPPLKDSVIYFLCHAAYAEPVKDSYLKLGEKITLGTLRYISKKDFEHPTLVFINACESAKMPITFFDGFLPYFSEKKAEGIIGTWSVIPVKFASKFGLEFFKLFLQGVSVDQIMYYLRRKFLYQYNNLLGLCYFSRCSVNLGLKANFLSFDKTSILEEQETRK